MTCLASPRGPETLTCTFSVYVPAGTKITATVADAGGNIDEVHHQRAFTTLAAQNVEIELVLQTRGREHIAAVLDALHQVGFAAEEQK